jgi:NAD(P)-dependent dehydrogenase (short-subunit alcohol dehydrogenase family)
LGRELARQYAEAGWHVIACGRRYPPGGFEDGVEFQPLNLSDATSILALAVRLAGRPIGVLINNAAIRSPAAGQDSLDPQAFLAVLHTNTLGPILVAQALLPNLALATKPVVANISSRAGSITEGLLDDDDDDYAYRCSKAALNMASTQLARDLKPLGVTVLALHPGWVRTDMGGPEAVVPTCRSAEGLRKIIATADLRQSGSFMGFDGRPIAW